MKQLWLQNVELQEIHKILSDEGYDVNRYEMRKITNKHGLSRRQGNGYKPLPKKQRRRKRGMQAFGIFNAIEGLTRLY